MKLGIGRVAVYRLGFYVDAQGAVSALQAFAGRSHAELCSSPDFYKQLMSGRFRKVFHFRFHKALSQDGVQRAYRKAVMARVPQCPAVKAQVEKLVHALPRVAKHDSFQLTLEEDGASMEVIGKGGETLLELESPEVWWALQAVYFDEKLDMPAVRKLAIQRIPERILSGPKAAPEALHPGIAVEELADLSHTAGGSPLVLPPAPTSPRAQKSWKLRLRRWKSSPRNKSAPGPLAPGLGPSPGGEAECLRKEVARLRDKLGSFHAAHADLSAEYRALAESRQARAKQAFAAGCTSACFLMLLGVLLAMFPLL